MASARFLSQSSRLPFVRVLCKQCLRMKKMSRNGGSCRRLWSFHDVGNLIAGAMVAKRQWPGRYSKLRGKKWRDAAGT